MKTTMKYLLINLSLVMLLSISVSSCQDNIIDDIDNTVQVNDKFTFATTQTIGLEVDVNDVYNDTYYYKVEVFDRNPLLTDTVANLLVAGVAKGDEPLITQFDLAMHVEKIYIRQTDPLQRKTIKVLSVNSGIGTIRCSFKPATTSVETKISKVAIVDPKAINYPLPASYTTLGSSAVTLSGSDYLLPAGTAASEISFGWLSNSALYVAGELTFTNAQTFYMPSNCKLVILPGGKVTFNTIANFEQSGVVVAVHPGATLVFNEISSVGQGSKLINDGTTNMNANFEIRQNSTFTNNGTVYGTQFTLTNNSAFTNKSNATFTSNFIMNSNTSFRNYGVLEAISTIRTNNITSVILNYNLLKTPYFDMMNGGGTLVNYCKVECADLAINVASVNSYSGSLISTKNLYANMSSIGLYGDAILKTGANYAVEANSIAPGVTFNYGVNITGTAEDGKIPVTIIKSLNQKNGWQVLSLLGTMEYVLPATETPGAYYYLAINSGVSFVENATVNIAASDCNNGGINADNGSGNPENPVFPMVIAEDNEYTFAMEDLWPNLGDYDMNDFVFKIYNITKTINAQNEVISMSFDIRPLAAGSTKKIAAALQFDNILSDGITLSSTNSIGSVEAGQTQANVMLFPDVHALFGKSSPAITNTYANVAKVATSDYTFNVGFKTPVSASDVIISKMNFYVIVGDVNSNDRKEVHLAGFNPSSKVQKETNNYKDSNNMVWAIMLPVGDFKYPTESTKIYNAYPKFNTWAASAGEVDNNWYLYPSQSNSLIYNK